MKVKVKLPEGCKEPYFGVYSDTVYDVEDQGSSYETVDKLIGRCGTILVRAWCTPVLEYKIELPEDLFD